MDTKKRILYLVIFVLFVALIWAYIAQKNNEYDKQAKAKTKESSAPTPTHGFGTLGTTTTLPYATTTRPQSSPVSVKAKLQELPASAYIDMLDPTSYTSYRYDAIINGYFPGDDLHSVSAYDGKIAITELDDPANSDLDEATFTAVRALAIDVVQAKATGVGTANYPRYFAPGTSVDSCSGFSLTAAGATKMPYEGDDSYVVAFVYYTAQCPLGAAGNKAKITSNVKLYLHREAYGFVPIQASALPHS